MTKKMHILLISHNYPTPVDESFGFFCRNQAEALSRYGHQVGVVGPLLISVKSFLRTRKIHFGRREFKENGVLTYLWICMSIPKARRLRYAIMNYVGKRMVDRYIRRYGVPDIFHLHVYEAAEIAMYAAEKYGVPLVWTEHFSNVAQNAFSDYEREFIVELVGASARRLAVSRFLADRLTEYFNASVDVAPNMYDSTIFRRYPDVEKYETFTFLSVAYMQRIKNHPRLIEAFAMLADLPVRLVIVGIGEMYEPTKRDVQARGLSDRVQFLGELTPEKVATEMNKAHAYVVSSDLETFNVTTIEALACGIPAVSTRCGGPEDIIADDTVGVLTERTAESLAAGMRFVYENISKYLPEKLAYYAREKYSAEAIAKLLTKIYEECA
ncbi:MAG TPA: glycosyltransferase [Cyclobacteriaceae bacterium]